MDHAAIRAFLLERHAANEPIRLRDVVDAFDISLRTAHKIRASLVAEGLLPAEATNPKRGGARTPRPVGGDSAWDKILRDVLDGRATILTDEQRKALLSAAIIADPSGPLHMQAQNALTRLNAASQTTASYSPGVPLSDEARIERLSRLMESQGLVIVRAALRRAFPRSFEKYDEALASAE